MTGQGTNCREEAWVLKDRSGRWAQNSIFGNPLPPGVTVNLQKSKTLLGTGSKGFITLKADAKALPIDDVPICILAHVSINFVVKVSYASPAILVSVTKD